MKSGKNFAKAAAWAALAALLAGCAAEKIKVDYVMPAKAVADVSKVNVVAIEAKAAVTGNLAGDNDRNAALLKQLLAMRLYQEGFYQVMDGVSSDPETTGALGDVLLGKDSGHGYANFTGSDQGRAKATLALDLEMSLESRPVEQEREFTLTTLHYKPVAKGKVPSSQVDPKLTETETVKANVTVCETVAKGVLKARFAGVDGAEAPVAYENAFEIAMPAEAAFDSAAPSQLKAFAAAVSPAIDKVVADISPYKETRELVAAEGGDERAVHLLNAKAFREVVFVVEQLDLIRHATAPDYENLGIAFEAMGDFHGAKAAYAKSIAACEKPEDAASAKAGLKRVEDALAGKRAVKESGAKKNKDVQFSK